ncbi:hypothetical protein [Antrihabitans sp. YC2-6]|uniref:hypothetical protein n=1 Tax=Antrihabitans sp. YC2-6 TaxID=2799498 RepID=UPI0018F775CA|nr:hypothetical protein [Antrihabitans sp. YC2-6]MBJ8343918.1 hypothetical protein [Antrihabitans sp. YC2-6]
MTHSQDSADSYDPSLEEPGIAGDPPESVEDFYKDSREGLIDDFGPMPGGKLIFRDEGE